MNKPKPTNNKFSVLVVDDEPANIDILLGILSPYYHVKVAPSGAIALKIVQQFTPDLILLDIMMPEMDGFEVCKQLKTDRLLSQIPVIFVTALTQGENEEKGFKLGAVDYITKPVSPSITLARVKTRSGRTAPTRRRRGCTAMRIIATADRLSASSESRVVAEQ